MENFNIIIAEDDEWYAKFIDHHLSLNPDNIISFAKTGKDLIDLLIEKPDVITLDYSLPDANGSDLLKKIKILSPYTDVIIISGQADIKTAINLFKEGAYDYIVKDEDTKDRLWTTINNIREKKSLQKEVDILRKEVVKKYDFSKTIIGSSSELKDVFHLLEKAVQSNINVSITGETGTGKEVIAKAIHYNSNRKKEPFIAINVSAIPEGLIESELFGHEKGAFTGAVTQRSGKFEESKKGTLFLDEIGEMDMNMQTKLLRVLQERELVRVGGNKSIKIESRILCATNKNLQEEVVKGNFRQDLYYRLIGLPIELPPLRDRSEDIILLAKHFISLFSKENDFNNKQLSKDAISKLLEYNYPGNVRELKSIIDLAMVMSDETIEKEDINFHTINPINTLSSSKLTLKEYNDKIIDYYLEKHDNNVLKVAQLLDIGKSTIYRNLKDKKCF